MPFQAGRTFQIFQTKFTDVNDGEFSELLRVRREVPRLNAMSAKKKEKSSTDTQLHYSKTKIHPSIEQCS